jgi:hypothetical protein
MEPEGGPGQTQKLKGAALGPATGRLAVVAGPPFLWLNLIALNLSAALKSGEVCATMGKPGF